MPQLGRQVFLSTLSLRRATFPGRALSPCEKHFYPRSPCGERQFITFTSLVWFTISIHALLAESDIIAFQKAKSLHHFYPRSPCGERPRNSGIAPQATKYFYPRTPCGERPSRSAKATDRQVISIHALLAESDHKEQEQDATQRYISIHALLAESDAWRCSSTLTRRYFYPRSPCGERRLVKRAGADTTLKFLSTLSLRRATHCSFRRKLQAVFLSTLSLRRATRNTCNTP